MSNLVIPNSFQTPNAYVDIAMQYLTGDEFKVLMFAVRHIFGFQDRIEGRQHQMSLSMFQHGTPWSAGTNLSKNTLRKVLKQLIAFNLLERIPIRDETDGGLYRICASPDWDAMKKRHEELDAKNRQRAVKMNAPAEGITSHVIPVEGITSDGNPAITSDGNPGITCDVIQTNPPSNPILKPKKSTASAVTPKPSKTKTEKPKQKPTRSPEEHAAQKAIRDAIVKAFGYEEGRIGSKMESTIAVTAWELVGMKYQAGHVPHIYRHCDKTLTSFTVAALTKYAADARVELIRTYGRDIVEQPFVIDDAAEGTPPEFSEDEPPPGAVLHNIEDLWDRIAEDIDGARVAGKR